MGRFVKPMIPVVIGNFIYALTVVLFLLPSGLVTGGTTGIALTVNHMWDISISGFVLVFNVIMLLLGFFVLGKSFALTTLASTFLYPLFLEICERAFSNMVLTNDLLLCTIFSGFGIGIALAFTYILFLKFSEMFVHTDTLSPAVALWLPNIVFAVVAGFLYRIAPK